MGNANFNLPWLFLPVIIESIIRNQGLQRIIQSLLAMVLIIITIWLAQLNLNAYGRLHGAQNENLLYHLEHRRDQLTAQLKQNRIDSLTYLAAYNKVEDQEQKKNQMGSKINDISLKRNEIKTR